MDPTVEQIFREATEMREHVLIELEDARARDDVGNVAMLEKSLANLDGLLASIRRMNPLH
jgi:hypothetical protein